MKVDVFAKPAVSYAVAEVSIEDQGQKFTFWLKRQDAFDQAKVDEVTGQLCDAFLGPVVRRDKRTKRVIERGEPLMPLPVIADQPIQLTEIILGYVAGLSVMQDWSGHAQECYSPEEIIAIAAAWPDTWAKLMEHAGEINSGVPGNDSLEAGEEESGLPSNT